MALFTIDEEGILIGVSLEEGETEVELPNSVRAIGAKAFTGTHKCTKVTLNSGCKEIREQAFYNNQTITELVISPGLLSIEQNAFAVNNPLKKIRIQGSNSRFTTFDEENQEVPFLLGYYDTKDGKMDLEVVLGVNVDEVEIPRGVSRIGAHAFANCKGIKKLTFAKRLHSIYPNGVEEKVETYEIKEIGDWAFAECSGLGTNTIASNMAEGMLTIPDTVEQLGVGAFWGCSNITTVIIEGDKDTGSLHYLPAYSFGGMEKLRTISIPLSVLGWDYQQYDPQNWEITFPSVYGIAETIGETTFQGSRDIKYIGIDSTPKELIPPNCDALELLWWSDKIEPMERVLSSFPVALSGRVLHITLMYSINGVEYSQQYASNYIPDIGFEQINLPILTYDGYTFGGWYKDNEYREPCTRPTADNPYWTFIPTSNCTLYAKLYSASLAYNYEVKTVISDKGITSKHVVLVSVKNWDAAIGENLSLIIPETLTINGEVLPVKSIGDGCCAHGKGFVKVEIPRYITGIGYSAFDGCEELKEITFASGKDENGKEWGSSLTTIKGEAFANSGITNIVLPDSVTSLYQGVFYNCANLQSITLNDKLISIGSEKGTRRGTFDKCYNLHNVYVKGLQEWFNIKIGYSTCNPLYTGAMLMVENQEEGNPVVEYSAVTELNKNNLKGVTEIPDFAFTGYMGLQKLDLTDTDVETIGEEAFNNCQGMTEMILSGGRLTNVGRAAFTFCTGVKEVHVDNLLNSLSPHLFDGCLNLEKVQVADGVESLMYSFAGCQNLKTVTFPNSLTTIYSDSFTGVNTIENITLGEGTINQYKTIFADSLSNIRSVSYQEGIQTLDNATYPTGRLENLPSLQTIQIPNSCKYINSFISNEIKSKIKEGRLSYGNGRYFVYDDWLMCDWGVLPELEYINVDWLPSLSIRGVEAIQEIMTMELEIPETLTLFGDNVFCVGLSDREIGKVKIPNVNTYAGSYFHDMASSLFYLGAAELWLKGDNGEYALATQLTLDVNPSPYSFSGLRSVTSIRLNEGVTMISQDCFSGMLDLQEIVIPQTLQTLNGWAIGENDIRMEPLKIVITDESSFANIECKRYVAGLLRYPSFPEYRLYKSSPGSETSEEISHIHLSKSEIPILRNCLSITKITFSNVMEYFSPSLLAVLENLETLIFEGEIKSISESWGKLPDHKVRTIIFHKRPSADILSSVISWFPRDTSYYFVGSESGFENGEAIYVGEDYEIIITEFNGELT
jgi:hypothetical protein